MYDFKDGILGFSTHFNDYVTGPLLVWELFEAGRLSEPTFAFYLAGNEETSYLDVGVIQSGSMRDPSKYVEFDVIDNSFWWMNYIRGVSFAGEEFIIEEDIAITDTGTTCVYMPDRYYDHFMSHVFKDIHKVETSLGDNYIRCRDVEKLPTVEFNLGYYWLQMLPEDYAIADSYYCFICILP